MLEIPSRIKELVHQDTCPKNIRIHFPNGERTDICNDLIVRDSVSFTESLCSQDNLKFGLCESPVFECEVVGVGNIKGATIEVSCEVYCSASDEGAEFKPDIKKYVYPIPLGTFVVQEAKRQADMQHRRIMAYNVLAFYNFEMTKFQTLRASYPNTNNYPFMQNLTAFITENVQTNVFAGSKTELSGSRTFNRNAKRDPNPGINTRYTSDDYIGYRITEATSDKLYCIEIDTDEPIDERIYFEFGGAYTRHLVGPVYSWDSQNTEKSSGGLSSFYVYPYMSMTAQADNNTWYKPTSSYDEGACISVRYGDTLTEVRPGSEVVVYPHYYIDPGKIHFYEISITDAYAYAFARAALLNKYVVVDPNAVSMRDLFNGFLETKGLFGLLDRFNIFKVLNIKRQFTLTPDDTLYPGSSVYPQGVNGGRLLPQDYQSCWYDDEYTKPFGAIVCQYKNTNNEDCIYTLYLSGITEETDPNSYKTYELNNNEIIKGSLWTEQQISDICNTIANNISGVQYMPVEFTGRGLPYVEAGDTFEILTKSRDAITTIVLNRTLTGEQVMTDKYKSV